MLTLNFWLYWLTSALMLLAIWTLAGFAVAIGFGLFVKIGQENDVCPVCGGEFCECCLTPADVESYLKGGRLPPVEKLMWWKR